MNRFPALLYFMSVGNYDILAKICNEQKRFRTSKGRVPVLIYDGVTEYFPILPLKSLKLIILFIIFISYFPVKF